MHWLSFHIISVTQDILFVMISWRHCLASSTSCTISILCICQCFVYIIYIAACISPHTFNAICTSSLLLLLLVFAVEQVYNMRASQFTHSHTHGKSSSISISHFQSMSILWTTSVRCVWNDTQPSVFVQASSPLKPCDCFIMTHICWITLRRFTTMLCMSIFTQPMHTDTHFIRHSLYFEASNDILLLFMCQIDPTITKIKASDNSNAQNGIIMKLWHDKIH